MARPRNADPEATMDSILAAASGLLRAGKTVSLRTIATTAEVSTSTVRYYFPTVQAILETLIEPFVREIRGEVVSFLDDPDAGMSELKLLPGLAFQQIREKRFMAQVLHQSTALSGQVPPERRLKQVVGPLLERLAARLGEQLGQPKETVKLGLSIGGMLTMRLSLLSKEILCGITGLSEPEAEERRRVFLDELTESVLDLSAIDEFSSMEGAAPAQGRVLADAQSADIIKGARSLVLGGEELSLRAAARACDRTLGAVRHYFPTRRALVLALIEEQDRRFLAISVHHMEQAKERWQPSLARAIDESFRIAVEERGVLALHHDETYARSMDYLQSHRATAEARRDHLEEFAGKLQMEAGDFRFRAHCIGLALSHVALLSGDSSLVDREAAAPYLRGLSVRWLAQTAR